MIKHKSLRIAFVSICLMVIFVLAFVACAPEENPTVPLPMNTSSISVDNTITLSYTLPIVPVTFSINTEGHISVALGAKITTPIGTFDVNATSDFTVRKVADSSLLLVIRHYKGAQLVDDLYRINVGQSAGKADIAGNIKEVRIGWNGKVNYIFVDASGGDVTTIVIQGVAVTPTTTVLTPTPSQVQETLTVDFLKNTTCASKNIHAGAKTRYAYHGNTKLTIFGTGKAKGNQLSDAFYIYTDEQGNPISPEHDDSVGAILFINDQPADNFIRASISAFNPNHVYTFTINAPGGQLAFSVGDCKASNNHGSYTITVLFSK